MALLYSSIFITENKYNETYHKQHKLNADVPTSCLTTLQISVNYFLTIHYFVLRPISIVGEREQFNGPKDCSCPAYEKVF